MSLLNTRSLIVGGLHRAFQESKVDGSVVRAFDWDQCACRVYEANYGAGIVQKVLGSLLRSSRDSHKYRSRRTLLGRYLVT